MSDIIYGLGHKLKNNVGGLKRVYFFEYNKYSKSQIVLTGKQLTTFPTDTIYTYELLGGSFSENTEDDTNGKFITLNLEMTLAEITEDMNVQLDAMLSGIFRAITLDNNGNYNMLGLYNGIELSEGSAPRGSGKSDLNGYTLSFNGKERFTAPFLTNLSNFTVVGSTPPTSSLIDMLPLYETAKID